MEDNPDNIPPPDPDDIPPVAADEAAPAPPKRKRGRPRKNPLAVKVGGDALREGAAALEGKKPKSKKPKSDSSEDGKWAAFCENDPRREEFCRRAMEAYRIAEGGKDDEGNPPARDEAIARQKQAEAMLKANEQFARAVGLDLKGSRSASNLNSAAAVMEYVEEVDKVLDEALSRLAHENPADYQRLIVALEERDRPECPPPSISAEASSALESASTA